MERVDRLGDELQTCTNISCGEESVETSGHNHQRDCVEGNQRFGRINEREDPEDQGAGLRLPQSSTLPQCNHVPLGRT